MSCVYAEYKVKAASFHQEISIQWDAFVRKNHGRCNPIQHHTKEQPSVKQNPSHVWTLIFIVSP